MTVFKKCYFEKIIDWHFNIKTRNIQSWCDKHGVTTSSFFEWKQAIISRIDENVNHSWTELTRKKFKNIIKLTTKIRTELKIISIIVQIILLTSTYIKAYIPAN